MLKSTTKTKVKPATRPSKPAISTSGSDFSIPGPPKLQANLLVFGDAKAGKSSFCASQCPEPVAYICFDRRAESAVHKAVQAGRRIVYLDVDLPANLSQVDNAKARQLGQAAVRKVIKNVDWAVEQSKKGLIRTIVLDTGTEFSEILNVAITGKEEGVKNDFGKSRDLATREWWRLFNRAREGKAHLVVLARAQEIWVNNEPTGQFKPRGPAVMLNACDFAAQVRIKKRKGERKLEMEITTAGINKEEEGEVYTEEQWGEMGPFAYSCWMQFIEVSEPENWT